MNVTGSPTYRTSADQKIKAKKFALMLKTGSPKLRDVLRENCRLRMKESRQSAFLSSRTQLINQIVQQELAHEIENNIALHENILKEIFENWEEWQNEEYEKALSYLEDNDENQVFCPICQVNLLKLKENIISCQCGLRLYYPKSLSDFYGKIMSTVKTHEVQCPLKLTFLAEPKDGFNVLALSSLCFSCNFNFPIVELI